MKLGKTHLWRCVLEPWSCYGVDIENLFCLGLRRVGFHLGEREWQNRKILFWWRVSQPVCPALSGVNMEGWTGGNGHEECVWGVLCCGKPLPVTNTLTRLFCLLSELMKSYRLVWAWLQLKCGWDYIILMWSEDTENISDSQGYQLEVMPNWKGAHQHLCVIF